MPFSPQRVLESLPGSKERGVDLKWFASRLGVPSSELKDLRDCLDSLSRGGLVSISSGRYRRRAARGVLLGTVRFTRSTFAFVIPLDDAEKQRGDLLIPGKKLAGALAGDIVVARVTGSSSSGREGRVESILQRANTPVFGLFNQPGNFVSPIDDTIHFDIDIARGSELSARGGDVVTIEITHPPIHGRAARGRVIEVLGPLDGSSIDLEIIIRKHQLRRVFPEAANREAAEISDSVSGEQRAGRADFRDWPAITIDGETARDFDDAVSIDFVDDHYRLGVHIADVSFYVRAGSALDEEALRRGTSVYFPERAIPMLPERLSNGICSLNPNTDRLTMSVVMNIDRRGGVIDYRITPSVIHSIARMTYTEVNQILTDSLTGAAQSDPPVRDMLGRMRELAVVMIDRRERQGAIDFDLPEAELLFNDEGKICGIARSERNVAHRLIEEFMLLANETVARHLEALGVPSIYRIHEEPLATKIEEFASIAESFGLNFSMHGPIPQRGFQHLLEKIKGRAEERSLSYLMLRSLERARYSVQNVGHFGLAMPTYTHFTSPIRRYPDLIVHRILREMLEQGNKIPPGDDSAGPVDLGGRRALELVSWEVLDETREVELRSNLEMIADQSSARERGADDAERELMNWRKAEFMDGQVGNEFDGIIVGMRSYGFYVELNQHLVEGLVHISTLGDDLFEHEERKRRLRGKNTGRTFRIGDRVRVVVDRVDRNRHVIYFSIVQ